MRASGLVRKGAGFFRRVVRRTRPPATPLVVRSREGQSHVSPGRVPERFIASFPSFFDLASSDISSSYLARFDLRLARLVITTCKLALGIGTTRSAAFPSFRVHLQPVPRVHLTSSCCTFSFSFVSSMRNDRVMAPRASVFACVNSQAWIREGPCPRDKDRGRERSFGTLEWENREKGWGGMAVHGAGGGGWTPKETGPHDHGHVNVRERGQEEGDDPQENVRQATRKSILGMVGTSRARKEGPPRPRTSPSRRARLTPTLVWEVLSC